MSSDNNDNSDSIDSVDNGSKRYPFREIEPKWRARWEAAGVYRTLDGGDAPKRYVLDMFPYPSGSGLHVGHCKNYVPGDVFARLKRMQGENVLHPMGWDAFGQPAEQDAIKKNVNPRQVVPILAQEYKRQLSLLGIGYDWDREINSTDPSYYKWNQWAFLLLRERGLAYRKAAPVNWDPVDQVVLSNDEVVDGRGWRSNALIEKRDMSQWFFKTTAYADKLLEGLGRVNWPEGVKTQQTDWIGRSEGAEFDIAIEAAPPASNNGGATVPAGADAPSFSEAPPLLGAGGATPTIRVFTTRVDTVFGMSFVVLAPEHALVSAITTPDQKDAVEAYRAEAARTSEIDRTAEGRARTGVWTGAYAINPVSEARVPVYIADYVLAGYGTGAIMAVPAHDARDFDFARRYDLPTPVVVVATEAETEQPPMDGSGLREAFIAKDGFVVNSGVFSGLPVKTAQNRIGEWMEGNGIGVRKTNFKLRDWLVSRQRYWGTPIPIIYCDVCGEQAVPFDQLPVLLPDVENYKPGPDGRSPLSGIAEFVNTTCPSCGGAARRETDTMAGSVDSSWYFLRFTSPHSDNDAWDRTAADYWMNVDTYIGGREHAVGHLLYARFFTKVFFDAGLVSVDEPFQTLKNQGMLLNLTPVDAGSKDKAAIKEPENLVGYDRDAWITRWEKEGAFGAERRVASADGTERIEPVTIEYQWLKMSKSRKNSVTPDEMAEKFGADALRLYISFEAPFEDTIQWSEERMNGTFRFLNRVWDVVADYAASKPLSGPNAEADASAESRSLRRKTHQTIARVTENLNDFKFNTAVSALMIQSDIIRKHVAAHGSGSPAFGEAVETFVKLLSPLAPHIADELWERLGHENAFLFRESWPVYDPALAAEDEVTVVVQVNGKLVDRLLLSADTDQKSCEMAALSAPKVAAALAGKTIRKVIVVPGRLVNIVAS